VEPADVPVQEPTTPPNPKSSPSAKPGL
jgi:hypothetical protein